MRRIAARIALFGGVIAVLGAGSYALAGGGSTNVKDELTGYEEVPALSTSGSGEFRARIDDQDREIHWTLSYAGLEGNILQSHIHLGNVSVAAGISAFLCTNLGNGPAGTQACPAPPATISGTIRPADVIGPAGQGIAPGLFEELVAAIRAGATYANVHSSLYPAGEIRAQLDGRSDDHGDDD